MLKLETVITCPNCGYAATESMPTNFCQARYECKGCGELLRPLSGDCCVYCSYATVPCPPVQEHGKSCC